MGQVRCLEIVDGTRLAFINSFADRNGSLARHPMDAGWPLELFSKITFEETEEGKAVMNKCWIPLDATSEEKAVFGACSDVPRLDNDLRSAAKLSDGDPAI